MKVLEEEEIPIIEAKKILLERAKAKKDLKYEQKILHDYFTKVPMLPASKAEKLREELEGLGFLNHKQIVLIINILPTILDEVMLLLGKEIKKPEAEKIIEIVNKYTK